MRHLYINSNQSEAITLLLLHGTGGTERDLLPLADIIAPDTNVLAVRGNVLENGMPRFFKRLAEGVFDEVDLIQRTKDLNDFLDDAAEEYNFNREKIVAIGYSNGANIAASLLFHFRDALSGAVLLHPMVPRRGIDLPDLSDKNILITAGKYDPLCPARESEDLCKLLRGASANVELFWTEGGHELAHSEIAKAKTWFVTNYN